MNDQESKAKTTTRRDFIKDTSLAAAGFMIVPRHVLGRGFIAPSDKLVVAGIGAGGKGESDIHNFYASGKAEIAYLCDVDDRRSAKTRANFPKAKYYKDWRELLDKEHKNFDAVSVSTPDHNHAIIALSAMSLGKHVYVQKPMTHDIYEARQMTKAAKQYNVVTQMGNQGSSGDGVRQMREWYNAGVIGEAHTIYCWTDRPVWPQGIAWPPNANAVPSELNWDLWLGTAPYKDYVDKLVPFNWRGWWDYGTGALGDMGCHIIEPAFRTVGLGYPYQAECSVGSVYVDEFQRGYFPDGPPPSSHVVLKFKVPSKHHKNKLNDVTFHWMDGGIQPERPEELGPNEMMGDGGNGVLIYGTKGKMMCSTYGRDPKLLPTSRTAEVHTPQSLPRVKGGEDGHYAQWVEAAIAGPGSKEASLLSSSFDIAGPLTETVLMGNLAIRSFDIRKPRATGKGYDYPGRYITLLWDGDTMKVTNFDDANQFVQRTYRDGWKVL
ncbi:Gfo/Idh/MocA family protein [Dinghuibacter silviterrae]|uniref:Oxidoreductase family protein n=1 Tax=Dinghuibacter silviterrae TaxID=1539049 RepID=A0A4R8DR79_9BACT|nr:Gfo/Idh/MocA family oxidoreductase [Dinghuibacter silviterrae]TDW99924.1 oxidoreductase family protein [Dinghuibacter silviterrae]